MELKNFNEKDFNNVETLAKRFNLEEIAANENKTGKDYCDMMAKILRDSKKRKRMITAIHVANLASAIVSGFLHGKVIGDGLVEEDGEKVLVGITSAIGVHHFTGVVAEKMINRLKDDITDNVVFATSIGSTIAEHEATVQPEEAVEEVEETFEGPKMGE